MEDAESLLQLWPARPRKKDLPLLKQPLFSCESYTTGNTEILYPYDQRFFRQIKARHTMARTVQCIKLGTEAEGLDFPPYPGDLGKRIWEGVSKQAWADWLKHQTMLVNENRLNLADLRARQYLARQMENHFFGSGADAAQGYVPPTN
jgi:Fe-S cluster biosynthesis and repair protein YggX